MTYTTACTTVQAVMLKIKIVGMQHLPYYILVL